MQNTTHYTYGLILDQISEYWVPFKLSQMYQNIETLLSRPHRTPLSVLHPPKNGTTI